jgi:GntR family transcriptional repressor for pyruvate dehydrogenase complex
MTQKNPESEVQLAPVETRRASAAIYDQIKDMIIHGELKPGDRLPSERSMMEMMGRSRPPIREALRMLEGSGFIRTIPGSGGAVVTEITSETVEEPLENMISLKQISHRELLEYRELNEVAFAGWAAERRTEQDLAAIRACIESAQAALDDIDAFISFDIKFHELLAAAGHNGIVCIVNRVLSHIVLDVLHTSFRKYPPDYRRSMCAEILKMHTQIYEAIAEQDSRKARDAMNYHLGRFYKDLNL